jgi:flavin-dependent dehydrogenase
MMLNNAREHGVEAHEGIPVLDVLLDDDRAAGVKIRSRNGSIGEVFAKVVVDASGQSGLLMKRLGLRVWEPILHRGAIWTYFEGAHRDSGRDAGATLVLQTSTEKGWFWYIPLHNNIVSVGVVAPADSLFRSPGNPARKRANLARIFAEQVNCCPAVKERISKGKRVTGYFATKDYSYHSKQTAGDGWVLVGDALGFLDPLYSSGLLLALRSGEFAADAIAEGLAKGDTSANSSASGRRPSTKG